MATVRKLVTKLSFEADLSQADKFERIIVAIKTRVKELNTALKSTKDTDRKKTSLGKLGEAFKNLRKKIDESKVGQAIKKVGKVAARNIKQFKNKIIVPLQNFGKKLSTTFKGITDKVRQHKFAVIGAITGAILGMRKAVLSAADVEVMDIAIGAILEEKDFKGGIKRINKQFEDLKNELNLGEFFTETEFKEGLLNALRLGVDPKIVTSFLKTALAEGVKPGIEFGEILLNLTGASAGKTTEQELVNIGLYDQDTIEGLTLAKRLFAEVRNDRKLAIIQQAIQKTEQARINTTLKIMETTSANIEKLQGEAAATIKNVGDSWLPDVNRGLEIMLDLTKKIKKEGFFDAALDFEQRLPGGGKKKSLREQAADSPHSRLMDFLFGGKEKTITPSGPGVTVPFSEATRTPGGGDVSVYQYITIDGNVTDITSENLARVRKQLQAAMLTRGQMNYGSNATAQ
jgi:hypothetical protein